MELKKIMLFTVIFTLCTGISEAILMKDKTVIVSLQNDNGEISLMNMTAVNSAPNSNKNLGTEYGLKIISIKDVMLYSLNFDFPSKINYIAPIGLFDDNGSQLYIPSGDTILSQSSIALSVPYFSEAKEILIYDAQNTLKLTIDTTDYLRCNQNRVCEGIKSESARFCPEDCANNSWILITAFAVLIIGFVVTIMIRKR